MEVAMEESRQFSLETPTGPRPVRPISLKEMLGEKPDLHNMMRRGFTTRKQRASARLFWVTGGRFGDGISQRHQDELTRNIVVRLVSYRLFLPDFIAGVGRNLKSRFKRH
jgi:hypothetical protein